METLSVQQARQPQAVGQKVRLRGWIRTRRDSKGGFSFLELSDGSCQANIQIIADGQLANYETEIKHLAAGCSVTVEGELRASPAKGQATEVQAESVTVHGGADPETYPLQKKRHSFEFLRTLAHLRPRTNTFGAIARLRNCVSRSIHNFFQERGLSLRPHADHHRQRLRGGRRDVQGHHARPGQSSASRTRRSTTGKDFFARPGLSDGQRPVAGRDFRLLAGQGVYLRPDIPGGKLEHLAAPGRVLDGRAGDGVLRAGRQHATGRGVSEADRRRRARSNAPRTCSFSTPTSTANLLAMLEQVVSQRVRPAAVYRSDRRSWKSPGKTFDYPVSWGADLQAEHERYLTETHFPRPVILFDYPRTHQAVLHARQRRRQNGAGDGYSGAQRGRDHRRQPARGAARRDRSSG